MVIRMLGGVFFLIGALIAVYNMVRTVTSPTTELPRHGMAGPVVSPAFGVAGA
jgi:cbb3-type cytochrome oxidase subunit 1